MSITDGWDLHDPDWLKINESKLTDRRLQILRLRASGLSAQQVAEEIGTTEGSVFSLTHKAYKALGVNCLAEAVRVARKYNII